MFEIFADSVQTIVSKSGFLNLTGGQALMILVSFVLMYLAIRKGFEPLLLLPIAFGMLLTNLPMAGMYHPEIFINDTGHIAWEMLANGGGLLDYLYLGVKLGIYPPLIFMGIGAMTDCSIAAKVGSEPMFLEASGKVPRKRIVSLGRSLTPPSGKFARNMPNAMGSNSRGSNFLTIARYIKTNETRIMTACCQEILAKPVPWKKFINASVTLFPQIFLNLKWCGFP